MLYLRSRDRAVILLAALGGPLAAQRPPQTASWTATVGPMALLVPRYEGASEFRVVPIPLVQVTFRDRAYFGPSSTGVGGAVGGYVVQGAKLRMSVEASVGDKRPSSRSAALAGMDDRDAVATVGSTLSYRVGRAEAGLTATRGLTEGAGTLASARLGVFERFGRLTVRTGIGATWADARDLRRSFGVTTEEAVRRQLLIVAGDRRLTLQDAGSYRPSDGVKQIGGSAFVAFALSRQWTVMGFGVANRLSDEAAQSPLVRQRGQFSAGFGLGRQFSWGATADRR